jgi:hypothetical protein
MFWSIVVAVLAVVLVGAWLYDRRHKVNIRTRGSKLEGAAAQARAQVDVNYLYNQNPGPGGGISPSR